MNSATPRKSSPASRFDVLDLMRFFAAFAVVLYHYSIFFTDDELLGVVTVAKYGYLGVPFFFMLSGFVITASAQNRSAIEFAISRASRLYPAFWAGLIFTVIALVGFQRSSIPPFNVLMNATIVNDYFGIPNIDGVYWTLQAELKFYGCVFILMALGLFRYCRAWVAVWLLMAIAYYYVKQPFFMGWFISPTYSFFFIGGICAYLNYQRRSDPAVLLMFVVAAVFSATSAARQVYEFIPSATAVQGSVAAVIVLACYGFFYLLSAQKIRIPGSRLVTYLGAISYPLYLVHNVAGKAVINYFIDVMPKALVVSAVIVFVLLVSLAIHVFIEKWASPMMAKALQRCFAPLNQRLARVGK